MSNPETANQALALAEDGAAEARRQASEAATSVTAAEEAVEGISERIRAHDGGPGIESLASERAIATARVEALKERLVGRQEAVAAASDAVARCVADVNRAQLAESRAQIRALEGELAERIERAAIQAVDGLAEIFTHVKVAAHSDQALGAPFGVTYSLIAEKPDAVENAFAAALARARNAAAREARDERERMRERALAQAREREAATASEVN